MRRNRKKGKAIGVLTVSCGNVETATWNSDVRHPAEATAHKKSSVMHFR